MTAPAHKPPRTGLQLTRAEALYYGARGGAIYTARQAYMVEGEIVTSPMIAARVGVSAELAQKRLRRERRLPGPVTWANLSKTDGVRFQ